MIPFAARSFKMASNSSGMAVVVKNGSSAFSGMSATECG